MLLSIRVHECMVGYHVFVKHQDSQYNAEMRGRGAWSLVSGSSKLDTFSPGGKLYRYIEYTVEIKR